MALRPLIKKKIGKSDFFRPNRVLATDVPSGMSRQADIVSKKRHLYKNEPSDGTQNLSRQLQATASCSNFCPVRRLKFFRHICPSRLLIALVPYMSRQAGTDTCAIVVRSDSGVPLVYRQAGMTHIQSFKMKGPRLTLRS